MDRIWRGTPFIYVHELVYVSDQCFLVTFFFQMNTTSWERVGAIRLFLFKTCNYRPNVTDRTAASSRLINSSSPSLLGLSYFTVLASCQPQPKPSQY